jgi:hypothetical protein
MIDEGLDERTAPLVVTVLVSGLQLLSVAWHVDQEPLTGCCVDLALDLAPLSFQLVLGLEVSASVASIVGGGQRIARPSAISCAHRGAGSRAGGDNR